MIAFRRWLWWLLLVPIAIGVFRLRFDVEVMNLLPDDFPVVRGLKLYQANFSNARELIITVSASDGDTAETSAREIAERLRAATNLVTEVVWQPLWLEKPGQSAELVAYLWLNQPPREFVVLAERLRGTNLQNVIRESRDALTTSISPSDLARRGYDPLGLTEVPSAGANTFGDSSQLFASADGAFRILFVKAARDISDYRKCTKWLNEVRAVVGSALQNVPVESRAAIRYTGRPAFVSEISTGMQQDLAGPSGATLAVIAVLFYLVHRRIKPLLWLTVLLLVILAGTAALGGLVYGTINVISLGFASILLGLAEDFGVVLYQESRSHPQLSAREVRRIAAPGVFWSAVTTCSAFLALNFSGLPGLGQLGTLVAIGIAFAAVVMLFGYLPPLMRQRAAGLQPADAETPELPVANRQHVDTGRRDSGARVSPAYAGVSPSNIHAGETPAKAAATAAPQFISWLMIALICAASVVLCFRRPAFDNSPDALRPKKSEAYSAAEEIKAKLRRTQEPLWLLATGRDEAEILRRLKTAETVLTNAVSHGVFSDFMLPLAFWPNPSAQSSNKVLAAQLAQRRDELRAAIVQGGFTGDAFALTDSILSTWQAAQQQTVFWPTNDNSRWILEKFVARNDTQWLALGLVNRNTNASLAELTPKLLSLGDELARDGVFLSGWEMLGHALFTRVRGDFWKVLLPMAALVLASLWLAYRDLRDVLLSVITLAVTGLLLWAAMAVFGWSWNLLNLMAIPLLLGMGVDFSIHVQLALRRTNGDLAEVRGSIGRALLLAGSTTVAGFASLAFSNNAGMASLGKVCATGIVCAMLVSVYRLPHWWKLWHRAASRESAGDLPR